jgi:hypothetical protein
MERKESTYRLENKHHSQNIQNTGNKLQRHNYKRILLKCIGYQILNTVINNRIKKYTDSVNGEYQAELKSGKPTIDEIFTVRIC